MVDSDILEILRETRDNAFADHGEEAGKQILLETIAAFIKELNGEEEEDPYLSDDYGDEDPSSEDMADDDGEDTEDDDGEWF